MRIAIDVKGTLEGPHKQALLGFIEEAQSAGHEVVIWSSLWSFAEEAVLSNKLDCQYMLKFSQGDVGRDQSKYFDLAIDDDRMSTYLAAKRFVFVGDIPKETPRSYLRGILSEIQAAG